MSEAFAEIVAAAERAAIGSAPDKSALAQLLNDIGLARQGTPEERAYLAVLLDRLGMQQEAALTLRLSNEHDDREAHMPNLGGALASGHGDYERARELFIQALSAAEDDPHTRVKILVNLAATSLLAGEGGLASAWLEWARQAREDASDGAVDVLLASTEFGIARAQADLTGMRAAISRLNVATRARVKELGADRPLALIAVASLAAADFEMASAERSAEGQQRALQVLDVAAHRLAADLGADHPQALTCLENMCVADFCLARASQSPDRAFRAARMLETVYERTAAALGENHPQSRAAAANVAAARRETQGTGTADDDADLLFRVYIPKTQLYAEQRRDMLRVFRDWLTTVRGLDVRQQDLSTREGDTVAFYADPGQLRPALGAEYRDFASFVEHCAHSPTTAIDRLTEIGIDESAGTQLVAEFATRYRRLELDLRHARESRILSLQQTFEGQLLDDGLSPRDVASLQIASVLEQVVPSPTAAPSLPAIAAPDLSPAPAQPDIKSSADQIGFSATRSIQGTADFGPEARQLLGLINQYADPPQAWPLVSALHEAEDPDLPVKDRRAAQKKLGSFLAGLPRRVSDAEAGLLENYLKRQLNVPDA